MREMQGAEDEVERSILKYVTETEFRKQRSRLRIFTHRPFIYFVSDKVLLHFTTFLIADITLELFFLFSVRHDIFEYLLEVIG